MSTKQSKKSPSTNRFRIKVTKNGPYVVSGRVPLVEQVIVTNAEGEPLGWREVKRYPARENYELCRCGRSKHKPFCDGMHLKVHFEGVESASRKPYLERAEAVNGPALKLTDVRELCVHAGFCDRAGGTWELTRQSGDPEARKIAIEEAGNCPSGRLVVWDEKGKSIEPELEPSIALVENPKTGVSGPIWVRGGVTIECADGTTYEVRNRVTLCRCDKSANMPFCDGSHLDK